MIRLPKGSKNYPLSFIQVFSGCIDQLLENLETLHNLLDSTERRINYSKGPAVTQIRKTSESILLFREQIHKWRKITCSPTQQKSIMELEQKLYRATKLNSALAEGTIAKDREPA